MSPAAHQLDLFDQLSYFEGADVEYKSARGGLPRSLWETYSAFANSAGGTIWLGVVQKDGRLEIQGLDNAEKLIGDFWDLVNNKQKVSRNLLKESDVELVKIDVTGLAVVRIHVPRATRRERPIFLGQNPFGGAYRRNYEGDYLCTEEEVRRMFADQADESADARVLEGFGIEDLHQESLKQFRNRFASARPGHPWLSEDDKGLLSRLGGWRVDRLSRKEGLTVAGLLMFGREHSIRDPSALPGFHLDYRERFSDDPAVRWTDRVTLDGTWEGNLFQFYQRVILKLGEGPGIKTPFQIDSEGYRRAATPVHEALQEALVNALIHADHGGQGGIVIDRYPDRLEFSNPGTLLVSREQLLIGGISECRNKSLQQMFQMLGVGDKAGSGIDKIRKSWAAQTWQSPRIRETHRPDRVQLVLPMVSTLPGEVVARLDGRFGAAFRSLNSDEVQAVVAAEVEGEVTNQRLQEMLSLHSVDITRMLRGLVRKKFLVQDGQGRGTRYLSIGKFGGMESENQGATPLNAITIPPDLPNLPPGMAGNELEPHQDPALIEIAEAVSKTGKAPKDLVKRTIIDLCTDRFLSLRDLSALLNREQETLRTGFISKMVREGLLELRYPDIPSHREQAYRTASKATAEVSP